MPTPTQSKPDLRNPRSYGTARKSEGPEIPDVDDGEHPASIKNVQETTTNYNGEEREQFVVEFELLDMRKPDGNYQTLRSYIAIPPTLISDGKLNENSNLYAFMTALYGDLGDEIVVEPLEWIGEELRVLVENIAAKEGKNAGIKRPRITKYLAKRAQKASAPAAQKEWKSTASRAVRNETPDEDF